MRQKPWYEFHFKLGILFDQNLLANVKTGLIINGGRQEKKPRKVESFLSFLNNEKSFPLPPLIQEQWQIFIPSYSLLSPFDYCWWDNWTGKTDTNWQNYNDAFSMVPHGSDSKNPPKLNNQLRRKIKMGNICSKGRDPMFEKILQHYYYSTSILGSRTP